MKIEGWGRIGLLSRAWLGLVEPNEPWPSGGRICTRIVTQWHPILVYQGGDDDAVGIDRKRQREGRGEGERGRESEGEREQRLFCWGVLIAAPIAVYLLAGVRLEAKRKGVAVQSAFALEAAIGWR